MSLRADSIGASVVVLELHAPVDATMAASHAVARDFYLPVLSRIDLLAERCEGFRAAVIASPLVLRWLSDPDSASRLSESLRRADGRARAGGPWSPTYRDQLRRRDWDLLGLMRELVREGRLEILTTAATHSYLPFWDSSETSMTLRAEIYLAVEMYKRCFGRTPRGFAPPGFAYCPGLEEVVGRYEVKYLLLADRTTSGRADYLRLPRSSVCCLVSSAADQASAVGHNGDAASWCRVVPRAQVADMVRGTPLLKAHRFQLIRPSAAGRHLTPIEVVESLAPMCSGQPDVAPAWPRGWPEDLLSETRGHAVALQKLVVGRLREGARQAAAHALRALAPRGDGQTGAPSWLARGALDGRDVNVWILPREPGADRLQAQPPLLDTLQPDPATDLPAHGSDGDDRLQAAARRILGRLLHLQWYVASPPCTGWPNLPRATAQSRALDRLFSSLDNGGAAEARDEEPAYPLDMLAEFLSLEHPEIGLEPLRIEAGELRGSREPPRVGEPLSDRVREVSHRPEASRNGTLVLPIGRGATTMSQPEACRLSVMMAILDQPQQTRQAIESIQQHTDDFELLVWDNGSGEATQELLSSYGPRVRVFRSESNLGFIIPHNRMAKQAGGRFLCVMNNDVVVGPNWSEALLAPFQSDPLVAQTGPVPQFGHINEDWLGCPGHGDPEYLDGWTFVIPRWWHQRFGLFDEDHLRFAYCEDTDLSLRIRELGYKIVAMPDCKVSHEHAATRKSRPELIEKCRVSEEANRKYLRRRWAAYHRDRRFGPHTVAVLRRGANGDMISAEPALHGLRAKYANSHIRLVTDCTEIMEGCPHVDEVTREMDYAVSATIDLNLAYERDLSTHRGHLLCAAAGVPFSWPRYWLRQPAIDFATKLLGPRDDVIVFQPWATWPNRRWPFERFRELARRLARDFLIVQIGGLGEPALDAGLDARPLSFPQSAAVISRARLLVGDCCVGNHLASALQVPSVIVYGPTGPETIADPHFTMPVRSSALSCLHCHHEPPFPKTRTDCHKNRIECLESIETEQVLDAVQLALQGDIEWGTSHLFQPAIPSASRCSCARSTPVTAHSSACNRS